MLDFHTICGMDDKMFKNKLFLVLPIVLLFLIVITAIQLVYLRNIKDINRLIISSKNYLQVFAKESILKEYSVKGIDVSNYQGNINWEKVKNEGYMFAFLKSTEGEDFIDKTFKDNFKNAKTQGIKVSAYHFYNFNSTGKDQAKNFINIVPKDIDMNPVLDLEYDNNSENVPDRDKLIKDLKDYIKEVESHYNKKVLIYVNYHVYYEYIYGEFKDNPLWISYIADNNPYLETNWDFWQYSHSGKVDGIEGDVDLNYYKGTIEEFNGQFFK